MRRSLSFSRGRTSPAPWGRRFRWLAVALLLYTLAGFFLLPALLRWQLVKRLPGLTHRQAAVQKVKFNPYALTLSIQGLALTETNGTPFAGWDELFVNFQLSSLFHRAWTFREIRLERPTATILRAASGQCNFANLGRPAPASAPAADEIPKPPPAVRIGHLIVTNGVVTFADQTPARPMRLEIHPLNLDLRNLATRRDEKGQYALTLRSADGGHWDWAGTLALNPPRSAGTFTVRGARLAVGAPYLAELTRAEIADGRLDASGEYRLAAEPALQLEITHATVKIEHLQLTDPGAGETLLALNQFDAGDASFHLAGRQVRLPRVVARGGAALLRRADDGQWNWARQLVARPPAPPASAAPAAAPAETRAPWEVAVAEFRLEDFAVVAEDHVPAPPASGCTTDGHRCRRPQRGDQFVFVGHYRCVVRNGATALDPRFDLHRIVGPGRDFPPWVHYDDDGPVFIVGVEGHLGFLMRLRQVPDRFHRKVVAVAFGDQRHEELATADRAAVDPGSSDDGGSTEDLTRHRGSHLVGRQLHGRRR